MALFDYVSKAAYGSSGNSMVVTALGVPAVGDILVCFIAHSPLYTLGTPPSGWNSIISWPARGQYLFWKYKESGDPASWTWSIVPGSGSRNFVALLMGFEGAPDITVDDSDSGGPSTATTLTLPSTTALSDGSLLLAVMGQGGNRSYNPPASMTEIHDSYNATGNGTQAAAIEIVNTGATGTRVFTGASLASSGFVVIFGPPPGGSSVDVPLGAIETEGLAIGAAGLWSIPLGFTQEAGIAPSQSAKGTAPLGLTDISGLPLSANTQYPAPLGVTELSGIEPFPEASAALSPGAISGVPLAPLPMARGITPLGSVEFTPLSLELSSKAVIPIGEIVLTGLPFILGQGVEVPLGIVTTEGIASALGAMVSAPLGTIEFIGIEPEIGQSVSIPLGEITSIAIAPEGISFLLDQGELTLSGLSPEVFAQYPMAPGEITLEGISLTVDIGGLRVFNSEGMFLIKSFRSQAFRITPDFDSGALRITVDFGSEE